MTILRFGLCNATYFRFKGCADTTLTSPRSRKEKMANKETSLTIEDLEIKGCMRRDLKDTDF